MNEQSDNGAMRESKENQDAQESDQPDKDGEGINWPYQLSTGGK